ncbi:phytanoyl-CoA dioxygenase [Micromonospora sp. MS34]|uniref:phytanoyl-CoA dioxygenase n=1 Tax=Micromonospora sp. MS34 TaxID=3385971 RepID=UPI0039A3DF5A
MDAALVQRFVGDGFVKLDQAVPRDVIDACVDLLWAETGADPDDPSTWTRPVVWVGGMSQEPFVHAVNVPVLHDAFDALVGPGRWAARNSIGSFPLRFPHPVEPPDAGWHIEGSYEVPGTSGYWTNIHSRARVLLMLFLFTEVDEGDAPTRIRVGSHWDVPPVLLPYGDRGEHGHRLSPRVDAASAHRPVALATGGPGDVYVCHPFLVHAAQPNHGRRPRFLGQPGLPPPPSHEQRPFDLTVVDNEPSPVGRIIRDGLRHRHTERDETVPAAAS